MRTRFGLWCLARAIAILGEDRVRAAVPVSLSTQLRDCARTLARNPILMGKLLSLGPGQMTTLRPGCEHQPVIPFGSTLVEVEGIAIRRRRARDVSQPESPREQM